MNRSNQLMEKGFTMVELIAVIVILGVLSATALPKFVSLNVSAKKAVLKQTKGVLQSTVEMARLEAAVNGQSLAADDSGKFGLKLSAIGVVYDFHLGAPETKSEHNGPLRYLSDLIDLGPVTSTVRTKTQHQATAGDLTIFEDNNVVRIGYGSGTLDTDQCYVEYNQKDITKNYELKIVDTKCG